MKKIVVATLVVSCSLLAAFGPRVIYGVDDRLEPYEVNDKNILLNAKSVAVRVANFEYKVVVDWLKYANFSNRDTLSHPRAEGVCRDEKFADQPTIGDCSAFLVAKDVLATAAHCITSVDGIIRNRKNPTCRGFSWVFNYELKDRTTRIPLNAYPMSDVYSCKKVIYSRLNDKHDFALIKLDREVEGGAVVKLSRESFLKKNTKLYTIGHPSGLPKKIAGGAEVVRNRIKVSTFEASLDTFGGGSGSPVFNANTHEVVGILVRGRDDYYYDKRSKCARVNACSQNGKRCLGIRTNEEAEAVTKIRFVRELMRLTR